MPELHKVTLNLYEGDFQRLQVYYADMGAGAAIRLIIHSHLARLDQEVAKRRPMKEEELTNV